MESLPLLDLGIFDEMRVNRVNCVSSCSRHGTHDAEGQVLMTGEVSDHLDDSRIMAPAEVLAKTYRSKQVAD